MITNAGRLNKLIEIHGKKQGTTDKGFSSIKEEKLFSCWASVQPIRASEILDNETLQNTETVKFVIRYRKNLDSNMTIYYNGSPYQITAIINPFGDNESLEILADKKSRGKESNNKTIGGTTKWQNSNF